MAMTAVGTVLLVVGGLALLGGLAWVGVQAMQQDKNNDGMFTNPEEGQENKDQAFNGFYLAGAGLLVAILGVVLTVAGRRSAA